MKLRLWTRIALCTLMVAAAAALPGTAALAAPAARATAGEDCDATKVPASAGQPVSGSIPVLFVHGLDSSPSIWDGPGTPITDQVAALQGVTAWTYDYSKVAVQWVTDPQIGLGLADAITCLAQATGKQVIVVAHSMGGLATQYAVSQTGTDGVLVANHVAKVITIGTPTQGSLSGAIAVDAAAGAEAAISLLGGPTGKTLVAGIDAARSACAGAVIKDPQADPCSWFGLDETPAGKALLYGSSELAALPPWPSGLPVVAMAGNMSESISVGGFTTDVSLGDVIVSLASATAYRTSGAPVVVTCPDASVLNIFLDSDDELCYHHNLPRNPQIEAAVLAQIRQALPPPGTSAADEAGIRVKVLRTGDSVSGGLVAGPDGRVWMASYAPNTSAPVLQAVNPATYAVSTYPLPTSIGGEEVGYNGIGAFDHAGHLWLSVNVSRSGQQPTTYLLRYTLSTGSADLFPEDGNCTSSEASAGGANQLYTASDGAIWAVCQAKTGSGSYYFRISPEGAITGTRIVNNALTGSALWNDIEDLPNGTQDGPMAAGPGGVMWGISVPLTVQFTASGSEIPVTDSTDFFGAAAAELLGDGTTVEGFFANCPASGQTNPNSPACFSTLSADGSTYTPIARAPGAEDDLTTGGREPVAAMNTAGDTAVVMYGTMGGTPKEVQYYFGASSGGATKAIPFTVPGDAAALQTNGGSTAMTSDGGLWMVDTSAGSNGGALVELLPAS